MSALRRSAPVLAFLLGLGPACMGEIDMGAPDGGGPRGISLSLSVETGKPAGTPPLPLEVGGLVVSSAVFWVHDLQLVGDQGTADPRTRTGGVALDIAKPFQIEMAAAPPALYSRVRILFDFPPGQSTVTPPAAFEGRRLAFSVDGTVKGGPFFSIRSERELTLDLRAGDGTELAPGKLLNALLTTRIEPWFVDVPVDGAPGGFVLIDDREPQIERFRRNLVESFSLTLN